MLQLKRKHPSSCRLVNLDALSGTGLSALRTELGLEPVEPGPDRSPDLSYSKEADPILRFAMAERKDLLDLFADLELCADLYGRQVTLPPETPALKSLDRAAVLFEVWCRGERLKRRQIDGVNELTELRALAQGQQTQVQDLEEERHLLMLQLQQLQEELLSTFQRLQTCSLELKAAEASNEELCQRMASIREECNYYLSKSRPLPDLDQLRIPMLMQGLKSHLCK